MGAIMGARAQTFTAELEGRDAKHSNKRGKIVVRAESLNKSK
jgi:hypothetical protein